MKKHTKVQDANANMALLLNRNREKLTFFSAYYDCGLFETGDRSSNIDSLSELGVMIQATVMLINRMPPKILKLSKYPNAV